jgi:hypothetical protein
VLLEGLIIIQVNTISKYYIKIIFTTIKIFLVMAGNIFLVSGYKVRHHLSDTKNRPFLVLAVTDRHKKLNL